MRREIVKELVDYFLSAAYDRNPPLLAKYCFRLLKTAAIETEQPRGDWRETFVNSKFFLDVLADWLCSVGYHSLLNLAYYANRDAKRAAEGHGKRNRYQLKHLLLNLLILVFEEQYRIILNPADGDDPLVKMFKPALAVKRDRNTLGLYFYVDLIFINRRGKFETWFSPEREPLKYHLPVDKISAAVRPIVISLLNDEPHAWRLDITPRDARSLLTVP